MTGAVNIDHPSHYFDFDHGDGSLDNSFKTNQAFWMIPLLIPVSHSSCLTDIPMPFNSLGAASRFSFPTAAAGYCW